jgi:hypothetical protein
MRRDFMLFDPYLLDKELEKPMPTASGKPSCGS